MKITIIGIGYVGLITGVGLAHLGNDVLCFDIDKSKIDSLNNGIPTIYEEGLDEKLKFNLAKNRIDFTDNPETAICFGNIIIIAVGTPQDNDGCANLKYIL